MVEDVQRTAANAVDGVTSTLLEYGVLGAINIILVIALAVLFYFYVRCMRARVKDSKERAHEKD